MIKPVLYSRHATLASFLLDRLRRAENLRLRHSLWCAVPILLLVACERPGLETDLDAFREKVAAILGMKIPPRVGIDRNLPSRRLRRLPISELSVGGFDFLAFQGCRLGALVGQRNSPLGRQMVPSRRLVYELAFIEAAAECLPDLSKVRAARLTERLAIKKRELPNHTWNAIWLGEELETYLSTGSRPMIAAPQEGGAATLRNAAALLDSPNLRARDGDALEQALGELRHCSPAGALFVRLDFVRGVLEDVADVLETRAPKACGEAERALHRLFDEAYPPLQRAIVDLDRRAINELDALGALLESSAQGVVTLPPAMLRYRDAQLRRDAPDGLWSRYRRAVVRHAAAWRPMLSACIALPGEGGQG